MLCVLVTSLIKLLTRKTNQDKGNLTSNLTRIIWKFWEFSKSLPWSQIFDVAEVPGGKNISTPFREIEFFGSRRHLNKSFPSFSLHPPLKLLIIQFLFNWITPLVWIKLVVCWKFECVIVVVYEEIFLIQHRSFKMLSMSTTTTSTTIPCSRQKS